MVWGSEAALGRFRSAKMAKTGVAQQSKNCTTRKNQEGRKSEF
jgi:hypothetical protein